MLCYALLRSGMWNSAVQTVRTAVFRLSSEMIVLGGADGIELFVTTSNEIVQSFGGDAHILQTPFALDPS